MKHTDLSAMSGPVARGLSRVGEAWSILILRDALRGMTRFVEFENSLNIASSVLARRLAGLVEGGLLERRQYQRRPPRYEYVLTKAGLSFKPVLLALVAWSIENFEPDDSLLPS